MSFFKNIGKLAEIPFRVAQVPTKVIRAVDEKTIDSGIGRTLDEVNEDSIGRLGKAVKDGIKELDR